VGEGRLADTGDVFEQQMAPGQETHDGHFDDMSLSLDHSGNIVLNGLERVR
jgi:hypothetical protein